MTRRNFIQSALFNHLNHDSAFFCGFYDFHRAAGKIAYTGLPIAEGGTKAVGIEGWNYLIPKGSKHPELAWLFLQWAMNNEVQKEQMFEGGEYERSLISADVLKSMVNQADGKRIADSFDSNFNTIINMVESDIKASDYKEHKTAIKNMFENGTSIAVAISVDGTNAGEDFIPSKGFIENVKDQYFKEK